MNAGRHAGAVVEEIGAGALPTRQSVRQFDNPGTHGGRGFVSGVSVNPRSRWAAWVKCVLRDAIGACGRTREDVSRRLGARPSSLEAWLKPGRADVPPGDIVVALLCRDDILREEGAGGRERLLRALCVQAGYFCVRLPSRCEEVDGTVVALADELGVLARDVRKAEADRRLTVAEWAQIGNDAAELAARAMSLAALCREKRDRMEPAGTVGGGGAGGGA